MGAAIDTGQLLRTDARRRDFPQVARMFLAARDQVCRTPGCGAPIRHADHALAASKGGPTDLGNGNGRCARCNLTKDLLGWATHDDRDGGITTISPRGNAYPSRAPQPPTSEPWKAASKVSYPRSGTSRPGIRIDIQWPAEMARCRQ